VTPTIREIGSYVESRLNRSFWANLRQIGLYVDSMSNRRRFEVYFNYSVHVDGTSIFVTKSDRYRNTNRCFFETQIDVDSTSIRRIVSRWDNTEPAKMAVKITIKGLLASLILSSLCGSRSKYNQSSSYKNTFIFTTAVTRVFIT